MKRKVYVETTVVSYYTARPSRDVVIAGHQASTAELWPKFGTEYDAYISALVLREARQGDAEQARKRVDSIAAFTMLEIDGESQALAQKLLDEKAIPSQYPEDALHIALAAVNGIDILVSLNFTHINNPFTRMLVRQTIEDSGCRCPEICSPDELLEAE